MKITDIKSNESNPRYIDPERLDKLKKSIDGFQKMMKLRPIIVDESGVILGGNMRYLAMIELGYKTIPDDWVKKAEDLTEEEKKQFIIEDNVAFGDWDWSALQEDYSIDELENWGLIIPGIELDESGLDDSFDLNSDAKSPFQQITFVLADKQVEAIKEAIKAAKLEKEFEKFETFGNTNKNGNAIMYIIKSWVEQRKSQ